MEIIIDGYNLIGSTYGLGADLEHRRNWLVQRLSLYQEMRGHRIIVVFDGWNSGSIREMSEQPKQGLRVVFSRHGEKADSVVVRLARENGSGSVVVSSDREVRRAVAKFGAAAIYADEFGEILRNLELISEFGEYQRVPRSSKQGNPNRLSKVARKRLEKLKKLR